MSPRAFEPNIVQVRLRHLRTLLDDLQRLGPVDRATLDADYKTRYAAERILTQLVDVAVGINTHVGAALLGKVGSGYGESFDLLVEAGAVSKDTAARLKPSVGARNVLIHEYLDIDYDKVAAGVMRAPVDYGDYVRQVAEFMLRRDELG